VKKAPSFLLLHSLFVILFIVNLACNSGQANIPAREDYLEVASELRKLINHEMADKDIPAFSIALVDSQQIVWAQGFGMADSHNNISATAETVYRVASVSKLFTDIAIMQLVERGELDLDTSITTYVPEFRPENPFDKPITLRQLMSHRSGLVREPPAGNYFDPTEPTLQQMVASLNTTALVYEPESRTKYSNAGIGLVGYVLERIQGEPFASYVQRAVLQPMGMQKSSFDPVPEIMT